MREKGGERERELIHDAMETGKVTEVEAHTCVESSVEQKQEMWAGKGGIRMVARR